MTRHSSCWLVVNPASGSNSDDARDAIVAVLTERGIAAARIVVFPDEALPDAAALDAAGTGLVVAFAGDGTLSALINHLAGWGGQVLVLPGGTMNLLPRRLHGDASAESIIAMVAAGAARARRIAGVRCEAGVALAGLLVGPGTSWSRVRESMRSGALTALASEALGALRDTTSGPAVVVPGHRLMREGGYPLIELTPGEHGIQLDGFYADAPLDFAGQAWAAVRRNFREGPHDRLGLAECLTLESADGSPLACLIDGEPAQCASGTQFTVEPGGVDLLATGHDL